VECISLVNILAAFKNAPNNSRQHVAKSKAIKEMFAVKTTCNFQTTITNSSNNCCWCLLDPFGMLIDGPLAESAFVAVEGQRCILNAVMTQQVATPKDTFVHPHICGLWLWLCVMLHWVCIGICNMFAYKHSLMIIWGLA